MPLSDTLQALRKSRKLTQREFAAILKIKRTTYASYEGKGRVEMDADLLQKVANYYSTTVDAILGGYAIDDRKFKIIRPTGEKFMDVTLSEMAMVKATLKALKDKIINLEKRITKKPYDEKISRDLQKAIQEDYDHILNELLNK